MVPARSKLTLLVRFILMLSSFTHMLILFRLYSLCRYGEEGFGAIAGGQTLIFRVTLLG
jgi:hypothetical protein